MPPFIQRSIGLAGSAFTFPLVLALAVAVRLDSRGPAIHPAVRVGFGGRRFHCFKLRTMVMDSDGSGPAVTGRRDRRVTRVGEVLRRYRLDELPQLWNVARGEMLLVGPRPEDPRFVALDDPLHRLVFAAMPGITGLTQLAFADEAEMLDTADPERHYREVILPRKLALDADYLRRRSTALDLWILGQTVLTALGRRTPPQAIEARR
jgi:lipopolysaccharide/colanic/teichoic acid biosynthesis glycosyltransferase